MVPVFCAMSGLGVAWLTWYPSLDNSSFPTVTQRNLLCNAASMGESSHFFENRKAAFANCKGIYLEIDVTK